MNIKEQKTKKQENNGIPKKNDTSKTSKNLEKNLTAAADAYEKADAGKKAEMQNQLNVHQPAEKPEAMDEDDKESEGEQPVKKEPEESDMFVSTTDEGKDHSSKNDGASRSQLRPSECMGFHIIDPLLRSRAEMLKDMLDPSSATHRI
ncbi:hypothetical protein ACQRIT_002916 [Beauveria bassiana]